MKDKLLGARYRVVEILAGGGFGQTPSLKRNTHRPGNPKYVLKHPQVACVTPAFLESARRLFRSEAEATRQPTTKFPGISLL